MSRGKRLIGWLVLAQNNVAIDDRVQSTKVLKQKQTINNILIKTDESQLERSELVSFRSGHVWQHDSDFSSDTLY